LTIAAGVLGASDQLAQERIEAAIRQSPWRGSVSQVVNVPSGTIVALGSATAARDGPLSVVIHGRIDNTDALARELGVTGEVGSCLVAMAAYRRYGEEFGARLLGDFALLLLDEQRGALLGCRDWVGARPLFWGTNGKTTALASEPKQVAALLDQPMQPDEQTMAAYLDGIEKLPQDATFVAGVKAVLPNGQLVARDGAARSWARPVRFLPIRATRAEAAAAVRDRLFVAVRRRTAGAGRLGALCSGGMDSTSVVSVAAALAAEGNGPPVARAFTAHYPMLPAVDETAWAKAVVARWSIPWTTVPMQPSRLLEGHDEAVRLHDGPPLPGASILRTLIQAVEDDGADVLLTGEGGDFWQDPARKELALALLRRDARGIVQCGVWGLRHAPRWAMLESMRYWLGALRARRPAESFFEDDAATYLLRFTLESQEREGMRRGIRVEFPLIDYELAALLVGIPPHTRFTPGVYKLATRAALRGILAEPVRTRTSMTFGDATFRAAFPDLQPEISPVQELAKRYAAAWRSALAD
jgi:asparagine synthetase B (glutamine-hydrolysing)